MNWTTDRFNLNDSQTQIRDFDLNILSVRGGLPLYKLITARYKDNLNCYNVLSLLFRSPLHGGSFTLYIPPLDHLHPTLVDHPSPYLSTYLIRHLLWFFVSCDNQGSTVQRYSSHKCGLKSSCSAFNVVVTAFP